MSAVATVIVRPITRSIIPLPKVDALYGINRMLIASAAANYTGCDPRVEIVPTKSGARIYVYTSDDGKWICKREFRGSYISLSSHVEHGTDTCFDQTSVTYCGQLLWTVVCCGQFHDIPITKVQEIRFDAILMKSFSQVPQPGKRSLSLRRGTVNFEFGQGSAVKRTDCSWGDDHVFGKEFMTFESNDHFIYTGNYVGGITF